MTILKTTAGKALLFIFVCVCAGTGFAAETDWDAMSRKAEEAVRAVEQSQTDAQKNSARLRQSIQDVYNLAAAEGNGEVMRWLRAKDAEMNAQGQGGRIGQTGQAGQGQADTLDWLNTSGANPASQTRAGEPTDAEIADWLKQTLGR